MYNYNSLYEINKSVTFCTANFYLQMSLQKSKFFVYK